jgi:hypothetical protein
VGGVCGENNTEISASYNEGPVTGQSQVGGVIGATVDRQFGFTVEPVTACKNSGNVKAEGDANGDAVAGGVIGENSGRIMACYNTGAVEAQGANGIAGGVAGINPVYQTKEYSVYPLVYWTAGSITASYNTGAVTGATRGGVLGENKYEWDGTAGEYLSGTVETCYWEPVSALAADGIGYNEETSYASSDGCTVFSAADWPNGGDFGWDSEHWKSLGTAMDSPSDSDLPKLWWE